MLDSCGQVSDNRQNDCTILLYWGSMQLHQFISPFKRFDGSVEMWWSDSIHESESVVKASDMVFYEKLLLKLRK